MIEAKPTADELVFALTDALKRKERSDDRYADAERALLQAQKQLATARAFRDEHQRDYEQALEALLDSRQSRPIHAKE